MLIGGESGTGKEVLARYIHQHSARAKEAPLLPSTARPFLKTCSKPCSLVTKKGAFTGAYNAMPGKFEQAEGGTLLLDEITEMDAALQAKLRVLQERQVERLGGKNSSTWMCASSPPPTANGRLRCRRQIPRRPVLPLDGFPATMAALRERSADIPALGAKPIAHHASKMKRSAPGLVPARKNCCCRTHGWQRARTGQHRPACADTASRR